MTCNCVFCLFQRDGRCYKEIGGVKINERGMCSGFMSIKLSAENLLKAKELPFGETKVGYVNVDDLFSPSD